MTVVSGFYNSLNGDRKYDADAFGRLFEGLIRDGVFMDIGDQFKAFWSSGMTIGIGTGKAWFIRTWVYNDRAVTLRLTEADKSNDRIDLVCLDINRQDNVRNAGFRVITGVPSYDPVRPDYIKEADRFQMPIAFVTVRAKATEIKPIDIAYVVGTEYCPFVAGVNATVNLGNYIDDIRREWVDYRSSQKLEFLNWFKDLKYTLSDDAGAKLMARIDEALNTFYPVAEGFFPSSVTVTESAGTTTVTEKRGNGKPTITTTISSAGGTTSIAGVYDDPARDKILKANTSIRRDTLGLAIETTTQEVDR